MPWFRELIYGVGDGSNQKIFFYKICQISLNLSTRIIHNYFKLSHFLILRSFLSTQVPVRKNLSFWVNLSLEI